MENCIFCKIIKGEIPCYKIYEDDLVMAFLDINPMTRGHTLIIPKEHKENIFELDNNLLGRIISVAKKIAEKMKINGAEGVNLYHASGSSAEQTIFHFHLHVIPRNKGDSISFASAGTIKSATEDEFKDILNKLKVD